MNTIDIVIKSKHFGQHMSKILLAIKTSYLMNVKAVNVKQTLSN